MRKINRQTNKVIAWLAIFSGIIVFGFVFIWPLKYSFSLGLFFSCLSYGCTLTTLFWFAWDRFLWKWPIIRRLINTPNLSGRWIGTYQRTSPGNDGVAHSYVLEITQRYSTIWCDTYQENGSQSYGSFCELFDLLNGWLSVSFYWEGTPHTEQEKAKELQRADPYKGFTTLTYYPPNKKKKLPSELHGSYFTDRGTYGDINIKFEQRFLLKRYSAEADS